MLTLSSKEIKNLDSTSAQLPTPDSFALPERVLQFGTGVLLRGLPDYYIDKANKQGIFNGRILVVKSTAAGGADAFDKQDGVYTLCIKGIAKGQEVQEYIVNNAISRVVPATNAWSEILEAAQSPDMQIVISNTTEAGIVPSNDAISDQPPASFPAKLLTFLYARYRHFQGDLDKGMVILPTELIADNGTKLKEIIFDLAKHNKLDEDFMYWLAAANDFCNTLVDRIVPGRLPREEQQRTETLLGYRDELMIMAEPFSLWAIESSSLRVRQALSFAAADTGIQIVPTIEKFKEIKLRLLNGTHTLSCGVALGCGFLTVKQAMANPAFNRYITGLMQDEIGPAILDEQISTTDASSFAASVIDRFSNPFLDHRWESIALNYTAKMRMRNVPLLAKWYAKQDAVPQHIAFGFASYLKLMNTKKVEKGYATTVAGEEIILQDEYAALLNNYWKDSRTLVSAVLTDAELWGEDLTRYAGLANAVVASLAIIQGEGMEAALASALRAG